VHAIAQGGYEFFPGCGQIRYAISQLTETPLYERAGAVESGVFFAAFLNSMMKFSAASSFRDP